MRAGSTGGSSRVRIATEFVELVNSQNLNGVIAALTEQSRFFVEGEPETVGRSDLRVAWAGYFAAFPSYVIFVDEIFEEKDAIYLVGHTSGSHLPREVEQTPSSAIWRCEVVGNQISEWSIYPGSAPYRARFGLATAPTG